MERKKQQHPEYTLPFQISSAYLDNQRKTIVFTVCLWCGFTGLSKKNNIIKTWAKAKINHVTFITFP